MSTEKFAKKTSRNTDEWGSPNEYGDSSKRQKSGNKKDRRQNDKRKSTERSEEEWE